MSHKGPTIASILEELATQFSGIVAAQAVYDKVLQHRPSQAKDPYASIRDQLRFGAPRIGWVWLGEGQLMPLQTALQGLQFRLIPSEAEVAAGALSTMHLRPFVPYGSTDVQFVHTNGQRIPQRDISLQFDTDTTFLSPTPARHIHTWFTREAFVPGDSILVRIQKTEPLTLRLEREPAAALRSADIAEQDQELVESLVKRVTRGNRTALFCEDSVLAIYARASWRTQYPGRPWRQLVEEDPRLQLLDGELIADNSFRRPFDFIFGGDRSNIDWATKDAAILEQIDQFQNDLLTSRRTDAEQSLWDGIAPRISTSRTIFNLYEGTAETIYPGSVNALEDYLADIEERITSGEFQQEQWIETDDIDDMLDFDDDPLFDSEFEDGAFEDDELDDIDDIGDIQTFLDQNPVLGEATRQMMASLSPEELEQLHDAQTLEDIQRVLSGRLADLLRTHPSLFVPLDTPSLTNINTNGHAHTNGNGHHPEEDSPSLDEEDDWEEADALLSEEFWDGGEENEEQTAREEALKRSNELMEQFYEYQKSLGRSETTSLNRTRDLWIYADFLGRYYAHSLDEGDYATLDECLFFYYPRKVLNRSEREAREMCISIKQFYAFLKTQNYITDDAFAIAIWQRRNQAARVIELYDQIDNDSPHFERMFAHLFAPYTA
ncbi:MAG: hypothetical protein GFH27_549283n258 [Chloroflexi bacterium AL-W]|nr:hypothetical protein [Chloroflexi bacterium AL-N1]NOK64622.1 hypothetical protein [Chloroflexi bacterium AL-N10]NOK75863.1 hypothetical protein [Chloroflexi bacterium AL-N5]NOK80379.1 hypothetical protein [Chloroflexi bacterium AL-W]NOK86892.1 hypothetical protein [Chloroflexi bacterium AL-N15]